MGTDANDEPLDCTFNMFILDPILKIVNAVTTSGQNVSDTVLGKLGLQLLDQEQGLEASELLNAIMLNFLSADKAVLEIIIIHLLSPRVAWRY